MKYFITYFRFLLKSKNQHAVHSPFIYAFVTKCFYDTTKYSFYNTLKKTGLPKIQVKKTKLLFRLLQYFKSENALVIGKYPKVYKKAFQATNTDVDYSTDCKSVSSSLTQFDFILFENQHSVSDFQNVLSSSNNNTVLVFDSIHSNKNSLINWENIKQQKTVIVSVDCYYFGIVFLRQEQAKEHFTIRV